MTVVRSLVGAWHILADDPVRVLVPAAGALLLQVVAVLVTRWMWPAFGFGVFVAAAVGLQGLRVVLTVPLRAAFIAAGARTLDVRVRGWPRVPSLFVVVVVSTAVELAVAAPVLGVAWTAGVTLLERGAPIPGMVVTGIGLFVAVVLVLVVRSILAFAPIEAVAGRAGPVRALSEALHRAPREIHRLIPLVVGGEAAVAVGALACGAGMLPGYPIGDLAVLHRWVALKGTA